MAIGACELDELAPGHAAIAVAIFRMEAHVDPGLFLDVLEEFGLGAAKALHAGVGEPLAS